MTVIRTTINGAEIVRDIPDNLLLIELLRDDLQLVGTKEGCSVGVCGLCTVLLDEKLVSACLTLAVYADRSAITTIEGVAKNDELHPVQQAFIECGGFQCGICTSGQIMSAIALLDENPSPTRGEIQYWMMGNLCRCTGYYKIIESIELAAQRMTT
jgi:aerobic carbon-monoxide dehydrogenase small subunit